MVEAAEMSPILIVDDDPDLRESLAMVLEDAGYPVLAAANGRVAYDLLEGGLRPGLILLDLMMPVMNGWQFREAQLGVPRFSHLPVVVLSASENLATRGEAFGGCATASKPVSLDHLRDVVETYYRSAA